jgi:uncharacterized protein (DUF4415 family)
MKSAKAKKALAKELSSARKSRKAGPGRRPAKEPGEKFVPISIRLHPKILDWARKEARKKDTGYQTVINETLLGKAH